jgi:hypothetical protein
LAEAIVDVADLLGRGLGAFELAIACVVAWNTRAVGINGKKIRSMGWTASQRRSSRLVLGIAKKRQQRGRRKAY